jgi:uncharacterized protein
MMDLSNLEQSIGQLSGDAYPLEKWHPTLCQKMDLVIDVNGQWIHQGDIIKRDKLVALFSKILLKQDGRYYLLTPAEKLEIRVEDAPFVMVDFEVEAPGTPQQIIWFISNIGDRVPLSPDYPLGLKGDDQRPYVNLWRGLDALISRNVYYKLVDLAKNVDQKQQQKLMLRSFEYEFCLGYY